MQFSIRTLLIACVIVAIPFGAIEIYNSMYEAHCRRLEKPLYRMFLQDVADQIDNDNPEFELAGVTYNARPIKIYWALHSTEQGLVSPDSELIKEIGLSFVFPSSDADDGDVVYFIDKIRWVDWETVIIDRGSRSPGIFSPGTKGQKLKYSDGKWQFVYK